MLADERSSRFPILVFSAYVLISSARVEMSNKFVTLHPGIRARCRCKLSTIHRLRRDRRTALRRSTDVGKKLRGKRSEEVTASWRAVFYLVVASCVYTVSSWHLSSALKRGRRADNLSVSFLWMFSDGGHMVPVRRCRLNLYRPRHTSAALPFTCIFRLNHQFVVYSRVSFGNGNFR